MQDKIEKQIDKLLDSSKSLGFDYLGEMKKGGIDEKTARHTLRLLLDENLFKKTFGVNKAEYFLMEENHLTLEEARYVIKHPCLEDAENNCSYYKEHNRCVPFGCTLLNGWLYFKTSSNGKLKPKYKAWEALPKDTLFINKGDIEKGKLDEKVEEFLNES
jgi:hypothetical protein